MNNETNEVLELAHAKLSLEMHLTRNTAGLSWKEMADLRCEDESLRLRIKELEKKLHLEHFSNTGKITRA